MKSNRLKYLIDLISIVLFSLAVILIINPWLNYLLKRNPGLLQYSWIFIFPVLLYFVFNFVNNSDGIISRFLLGTGYLALNFLVIYMLKWPLLIFFPLLIILFILVYRFRGYRDSRKKLMIDVMLGFVILLVHLSLRGALGFHVTVFTITGFFLICFSLLLIFNSRYSNDIDFKFSYNLLFPVMIVFLVLVVFVSLILGYGLSGGLLEILQEALGKIINLVSIVLGYLAFPIFYLFSLISRISPDRLSPPENAGVQKPNVPELYYDNSVPDIVVTIVKVAILLFIVYYITKRLLRKKKDVDVHDMDERESVFSKAELVDDLKRIWDSLRNNFTVKNKRYYDRNNPLDRIRETYYKFLTIYNDRIKYRMFYTPEDYQKEIIEKKVSADQTYDDLQGEVADIKELTSLYNKARYGANYSSEKAEDALKVWSRLKRQY